MEEKEIRQLELLKNKEKFTLFDYVNLFLIHKKVILTSSVIACLISIILAFFIIEPIFLSTGTVKTTAKSGGLSGLLTSGLPDIGDLGGFADITGGNSSKELALYENILLSRRCVEEAIIKFDLMKVHNWSKMDDAVRYFRADVLTINEDKIAGTMEIGIYDEDPVRAKEIAEFMINRLNQINTELNVQDAKNNREFIQSRYEIIKNDLRIAEDSLKDYQNVFGIAPDLQVQAASKLELELEAEIKSEEVRLDLLKKILSPDQAEIQAQEEKINALRRQLIDMQTSSSRDSYLNLKGTPDMVMNFLRLKRNVEIQNKMLAFILPLYEQAKIEENKETPSVLVLDQPFIPDKKAKPKRIVIVFIVTLLGFSLSYMIYFVMLILSKHRKHLAL
jgi:tyrosine-protein kinase Etk/Wzc